VFGSLMWLSALIRLLGSANAREMARHLLVATAALELGLFVATPVGQGITSAHDPSTVPVVLATILAVTTLIGCRARTIGFPLLGVGLVGVQGLLVASGGPCAGSPVTSLVGSVIFAGVAMYLRSNDDTDPDET
jgi:hypothetical protein